MLFKIATLTLTALTLLLASCATIFTGTSQKVEFTSEPEGAEILIDGLEMGVTPATIEVKKPAMMEDRKVTLKLEGYEDKIFVLQKDFQMVSVLNFFTGMTGFAVDILTGALFYYSPEKYNMELESSEDQVKLKDLPKDEEGNYLLTQFDSDITVLDEESGYLFHWKQ
jgi:hypothetical protein